MAGAPGSERNAGVIISTVAAIVATTTHTSADNANLKQTGTRSNVLWVFEATAETGTADFDITIRRTVGGTLVTIATISQVDATGSFIGSPESDFAAARDALPLPDTITYTQTSTGTISGNLYQYIG